MAKSIFLCNPASGVKNPVFGQLPENKEKGIRPSYLMVKAGIWGEDAAQLHRFWGWDCIEVEMSGPMRRLQLFEMFWPADRRA